jgi:hypothetical protein
MKSAAGKHADTSALHYASASARRRNATRKTVYEGHCFGAHRLGKLLGNATPELMHADAARGYQ